MNTLRKLFGLLFAVAFAMSSAASLAADKQYILTAAPSAATPAPAFTFTFLNDGNSSFNSLTLSLPSGWTASGVTSSRGTAGLNGALNVVTVNNINLPNGAGQSMTVTVTGVAGLSSACASGQSGAWTAQPWTGSSVGSGQKFNPKPSSTYPVSTSIPATCYTIVASAGANGSISPSGSLSVAAGSSKVFTIGATTANYRIADVLVDGVSVGAVGSYTFSAISANHTIAASFIQNKLTANIPATTFVNTAFPVTVDLNGGPPVTVAVTAACGATPGTVSPTADPLVFFVTLPKTGTCTVAVSAPNYVGDSKTIANVYTGTLACDVPNNHRGDLDPKDLKTYVKASDQGKYGLTRGANKTLTPSCDPVPYTFEVDVVSNPQLAKFIVPDPLITGQPVSAKYVVVWGRFDVVGDATNIWSNKRPKLSWGIANPSTTNGIDFVPALPCVLDPDNPDLALTYPNGFASVPTADLDKLLPVIPNVAPWLGNPYPQYQPGKKALMCVAQQGWTATGTDTVGDPLSGTPSTVQVWTTVIDEGDGWVAIDQ